MTGSIQVRTAKDGTKRYHVVYRAGGKQKWKTFRKRKEAERFLGSIVVSVHNGSYVAVKPALMKDVFEKWRDDLETRAAMGEVKSSTAKSYKSMLKLHLEPHLGEYRSDQLTATAVSDWRKAMAALVGSESMSRKTFNNLLNLLHSIIGWARHPAQSYLSHDPLIGQSRLRLQRVEADFLEDDEMTALLGAAGSVENEAVLHVALFAGLRRGEIFALQWADIQTAAKADEGGVLHVRRSVYQGEVTTPKTDTSTRDIDIPQRVLHALDRHRGLCEATKPDDFVFQSEAGTPMDPDNFYKRTFVDIRTRAELRESVGLHTLRHTYASLLIRQNESLKYVSKQLGHASIQITADTYGHLFRETSVKAMSALNERVQAAAAKPEPQAAAAEPERRFRIVGGGKR